MVPTLARSAYALLLTHLELDGTRLREYLVDQLFISVVSRPGRERDVVRISVLLFLALTEIAVDCVEQSIQETETGMSQEKGNSDFHSPFVLFPLLPSRSHIDLGLRACGTQYCEIALAEVLGWALSLAFAQRKLCILAARNRKRLVHIL